MAAIESNTLNVFWQHHIVQWQVSGLSQAAYCRQQDLCSHQFSYWKRQLQAICKPVADEPKQALPVFRLIRMIPTLQRLLRLAYPCALTMALS